MLLQEVQGSAEEQRNAVVSSVRELANSGSAAACSGLMERQRRACSVLSAISGGAASTQPSTRVDSTIPVLACRSTSSPRGHHRARSKPEASSSPQPTTSPRHSKIASETCQEALRSPLDRGAHITWVAGGGGSDLQEARTALRVRLPGVPSQPHSVRLSAAPGGASLSPAGTRAQPVTGAPQQTARPQSVRRTAALHRRSPRESPAPGTLGG